MIRPSKRLLIILLIICLWFATLEFLQVGALRTFWFGWLPLIVLGLVVVIDLILLARTHIGKVRRDLERTLSIGSDSPVKLVIHNPNWFTLKAKIFDHVPSHCRFKQLPLAVSIPPNEWIYFDYEINPFQRGVLEFGRTEFRVLSLFGLLERNMYGGEPKEVCVYPNFSNLSSEAIRATDIKRTGHLKRRRRGQGMDFDQLREYREGDSLRQIDWKATARSGKLISREYQDERDQRIMMLVDCGRRLGAHEQDDDLSHFDHILDAVLLLSYVGLHHGDSVGLQTMGGYDRFLAPQRSRSMLNQILNHTFDLQPTQQVSDYEAAAQTLISRERKRALVVIFTNLRDEDDDNLLMATRILSQRHLVLVANLREPELNQMVQENVQDTKTASVLSAAIFYKQQRDQVFSKLRANGVLCLDIEPKDLGVYTVNRYLEIKASGRL